MNTLPFSNLRPALLPKTGLASFASLRLPRPVVPLTLPVAQPAPVYHPPRFQHPVTEGTPGQSDIPGDVALSAFGAGAAVAAAKGGAALRTYIRAVQTFTVGLATKSTVAAYAAGFIFDPIRYLYQRGLRVVVPGPPVKPVQGLFTEGVTDVGGHLFNLFDPEALQAQRALVRQRQIALLSSLIAAGKLNPNDPRLILVERQGGFHVPRPGEPGARAPLRPPGLASGVVQGIAEILGGSAQFRNPAVIEGPLGDPAVGGLNVDPPM
jgi:hypothetical protein